MRHVLAENPDEFCLLYHMAEVYSRHYTERLDKNFIFDEGKDIGPGEWVYDVTSKGVDGVRLTITYRSFKEEKTPKLLFTYTGKALYNIIMYFYKQTQK